MSDAREVIANILCGQSESGRCESCPKGYACVTEADTILAALAKAGYKVLAREPTEEMDDAGFEHRHQTKSRADIWRAMWDAAP
jgi:hypothetical protein